MTTAKDLQTDFIKSYLKPTLKLHGYLTSGQTWWKNLEDFFIVINLQNSQWNSKEELSFCFNIGIALTGKLLDINKKKATYHGRGYPTSRRRLSIGFKERTKI